jgi:hypothetical protein
MGLVMSLVLGALFVLGCAGQSKTNTAHDETAEHDESASEPEAPAEFKMPESPKTKADDMGR